MGVLAKKKIVVKFKKPYKDYTTYVMVAFVIMILIWLTMALGCGYAKKTERIYDKAANRYNPITPKDSANAAKVGMKVIKEKPPIYKPGKMIRVPYPVNKLKKVLDTATLQHLLDSLGIAHSDDLNNVVDDCIESTKKARLQGLKTGYDQRNKELARDSFETKQPDTVGIRDEGAELEFYDCQISLRIRDSELIKATIERDIYKAQSKQRFWLLILLGAVLITSLFFNFKGKLSKPKIPN